MKVGLVTAVLVLVGGGAWFYTAQTRHLRREASVALEAIAQLKVDRIVEWRAEQLTDAAVLMESPFFSEAVGRWMEAPGDAGAEEIRARFRSLQRHHRYQGILLADAAGAVRLSVGDRVAPLHPEAMQAMAEAFRDRKPVLTDLHALPGERDPHLDVVAPLFARGGRTDEGIGAVLFRCDPREFLYPLVQSWPTPSRSAETLLVRRDGDGVLFLNDLRHRGGTALTLRIPLKETAVPAVMAVLGQQGVVQGRDYRGVEVLSALKAIPGSPWNMVAKVDAGEAFSVLRRESILILALLLGILAASAAVLGVFWQRREKAYYQAMFEAEAKRREGEARYRTILETAMDGFWMVDEGGRLLEVNEAYCGMSGYKKEELTAMSIPDLEAVMTAGDVSSRIQQIMLQGGDRFQSRHRRRDGSLFDVEVSVQYRPMDQGRFVAFLSDITERKQAENVLTYLARSQAAPGGDFFRSLARYLAETLAMDYVCIDRLEGDRLVAHTVAVYSDGRFEDNVSYTLKDTPCSDVVDQDVCCFPSGVRHLFPRDVVLQQMGAESYVGVTLKGYSGRSIGLIAVIGRRPLSNPRLAEFILKLVAERAAGELERNKAEEDLRKAHEVLEIRVRERTSELSKTVELLEAEISRRKGLEETLRESERQVRFFAAQCLTAQEEERRRIAGDLHDSLAGSLAALRFSMERTQSEMEKGRVAPDALRGPIATVEQNIREVRRIMAELRPSVLDDLGIVATIHWFCREFQTTYSHICVEPEMGLSEDDVPPSLKTVIFRIAQEAMNNIAKHSGATLVRVSLQKSDGKVALTIRDNGKGFDVGEALARRNAERGLGLSGMRERAQLSAGVISIESEGGGTTVQAVWPLREEIERAAPGSGAAG